jgi:diguanylate cyclase (GGDEF)-like protein
MRRLIASKWIFGLLVLVLFALAGAAAVQLMSTLRQRAVQQTALSAETIITLTVERNLHAGDLAPGRQLAAQSVTDMNADVAILAADGDLLGLEIWRLDGTLLYADAMHQVRDQRLPGPELRRVLAESSFTQVMTRSGPNRSAIEVFHTFGAKGGAPAHGIVEVLLPDAAVAGQVRQNLIRLIAVLGLTVVLVLAMLVSLRRRLLRREYEAVHDPLTGLGNRLHLAAAGKELGRGPGQHGSALVLLDLDRFKEINDTLGHAAGDDVLRQLGTVLAAAVRPQDCVVRLGGDEFAVLAAGATDATAGRHVAERIVSAVNQHTWTAHGVAVNVQASAGVAIAPGHGEDIAALLQHADVAMYQAKRSGEGITVYDPARDPHDVRSLSLLSDLRAAIDNDELVLHYQPKQNLVTGAVTSVEALVRWQHPSRGLLAPGAFLPAVEHTGLMQPLTSWVLDNACRQASSWQRAGHDVAVAVNISPRALIDGDLPQHVLGILAANNLAPELLELEITETAIMADADRAGAVLQQLRTMGMRVSIDDFGAGYTSLALLKNLPIDGLKIDRTFVTSMLSDEKDAAVTEAVIDLAHRMGLHVIAEGVETQEVLDQLGRLNCDFAQGYFLCKPLPAAAVEVWLTQHDATCASRRLTAAWRGA